MQIPEYEFDQFCVQSLSGCPKECYCHHSWQENDVIVANCSGKTSELPATLPAGTSHLLLSNNNLETFCETRPYFAGLKVLDLSRSRLTSLCPEIFEHLQHLTHLNLANSDLQQLPTETNLLQNLTNLDLANNLLEALPHSIVEMRHLQSVDISGNTFRCDCDTYWMTGWLIGSLSVVKDPEGLLCFSGKGRGKHLIDLKQDDVGCYGSLAGVLIGLSVSVVFIFLALGLLYKYRGYLKIWMYTRFGFHPWDKVQENPDEKDYDAFVSYCQKDAAWVFKTLLPYLEAPQCGFHLCVHERDFVPGANITTNIMTAIQYSRRTILVLSPSFLQSGWCDLEFQAAHQRALEDRSNYLIVVLLQEVETKDLDETLQLYMKTRTYISAQDKWFWNKILYALPKVPIDQLKQIGAENLALEGYQVIVDNDVTEENDDVREERDARTPDARRDVIAKLPPLFKRIHTYDTAE